MELEDNHHPDDAGPGTYFREVEDAELTLLYPLLVKEKWGPFPMR